MKDIYKTKFRREYGMTIHEIAIKYNRTEWAIWNMHKQGKLHQFIKEHECTVDCHAQHLLFYMA